MNKQTTPRFGSRGLCLLVLCGVGASCSDASSSDDDGASSPMEAGAEATAKPPTVERDAGRAPDASPPSRPDARPGDASSSVDAAPQAVPDAEAGAIEQPPPPPPSGSAARFDSCPASLSALTIPITVWDEGNSWVDRHPGVTSFLVPLSRTENLRSLNGLSVRDAQGKTLPAQFETLSRWGGSSPSDCANPVRFAYAHVSATPAKGTRATWTVHNTGSAGPFVSTITVTDSASGVVVDTGTARFTVQKDRFEGISGVDLVSPGRTAVPLVDATRSGGIAGLYIDHGGVKSAANIKPWSFVVERMGDQVVTLAVRGYYAGSGGARDLGYTTRLHFYAGTAVVRVEHTYYYGDVSGWGADGASNMTTVRRAWLRLPIAGPVTAVSARASQAIHTSDGRSEVSVEQKWRGPSQPNRVYSLRDGSVEMEKGESASRPMLAAATASGVVLATIGRMSEREPQALRFDPVTRSVDVDVTSSPMQVGGARGIWSVAVLDFDSTSVDMGARGDKLRLHAERPLLGTPQPVYMNTTGTLGPFAESTGGVVAPYFALMSDIHTRSRDYLDTYRITGLQIWPDLPRSSCLQDYNCTDAERSYFEGGDNNYWNWSKNGIDEFFRSGDQSRIYDFSLGEATTFAETLSIRTYHDKNESSSVTGLAPCYGSSRGYGGDYREGLNNRRDACPADYTYNKTLYSAFLATGDRRFVDYWEEAAENVLARFGTPPPASPDPYLELSMSRLSSQRLEHLLDAAEFTTDPVLSKRFVDALRTYVNTLLATSMVDGHSCEMGGTGASSAMSLGRCTSVQAWMMPVVVEWAARAARLLDHKGLGAWVLRHAAQAAKHHAVLGASGLPDISSTMASSPNNATNGWRTVYSCQASSLGIQDASCAKVTNIEADGYFYRNGLIAFLNVFGHALAFDGSDPQRVCDWLPAAYVSSLAALDDFDINQRIWGKASGEAFGMSAEAVGALTRCK